MVMGRKSNSVDRKRTFLTWSLLLLWLCLLGTGGAAEEKDPETWPGAETRTPPAEGPTLGQSVLPKLRNYGKRAARRRQPHAGQPEVELETEPILDETEAAATPTPGRFENNNRLPGVQTKAYGGMAGQPERAPSGPQVNPPAPEREWMTEPLGGEEEEASDAAQVVEYRAQVDRNRVHQDESFTFTIEAAGDHLERLGSWTPAALRGFDIINVQTSEGNLTRDNKLLQIRRKQYVLLPLQTGTLVIPSCQLRNGGRILTTQAITIEVEGPRTGFAYQRQFGNAARRRPIILPAAPDVVKRQEAATEFEAALDRKRAYVNQQVVLSVRLRCQGADDLKVTYMPPLLTGFVSEELPQLQTEELISSTRQRLLERTYRTALFPIHAGSLAIGAARAGISALNTTREYYTEAVNLEVVDLPADPAARPAGEPSALVGNYRLSADVKTSLLELDTPARLEVRLTGAGRITAAPDPQFPEGKDFVLQLAGKTDLIACKDQIVQGTRTFDYFLVPRATGRLLLPELGIRYFDPDSERWCTASVSFPEFTVRPGPRTITVPSRSLQPAQEPVQLKPNRGGALDLLRPGLPLIARPGLWLLHGAGLAVLLLAWAWKRLRPAEDDSAGSRARRAYRTAREGMRGAQEHLQRQEVAAFYAAISRTTAEYLSAKFGQPAAYITADRLQEYFTAFQVPGIFLTHFRIVLTACEYVRYAAVELPEHDMRSLYRDLDTTLYHFERFWHKQSTLLRPKTTLLLLLALLAVNTCPPARQAAAGEAEIHFIRGNECAQKSEYAQALAEYEKVIALGARDPDVYFNLGNTYMQTGQTGKAVLAYERGLLLAPGQPDLRYNLAQAQKTVVASPWVRSWSRDHAWPVYAFFTTDELAWAAVVAFLSGLLFLGLAVFGIKPAGRWRQAAVWILSIWLLSLGWSAARFFEPVWLKRAVVIAPMAALRTRPYAGADKLFTLAGGTCVLLGEEEEEWAEVKLRGRRQGWILRSEVAKIE